MGERNSMEALIIIANAIALVAKGIFYLLLAIGGMFALFMVGVCLIYLVLIIFSLYLEYKNNKKVDK